MNERSEFYELDQLLGTYFHQDWMHIKLRPDWTPENADAESVVRVFIEQNPPELLKTIAGEIDELLTMRLSEDELQKFLYTEFGCYYLPTADGISHTDWLRHVHSLLMQDLRPNE